MPHRRGNRPASRSSRRGESPSSKPDTFAWASAESAQVIAIRKNLRARGVDRKSMLVIGYWRRGLSENGYAKAANHDRDLKEYDDHEHDHEHGVGAAMREGAANLATRLRRRRRATVSPSSTS